MNFKIFAAFFVTLLAVHASSQSPTLKDDSIKEIVLVVFNNILKITSSALAKANNLVDATEKNQVQITADINDFVVETGKKINVVVMELIDQLKEGATDDGKAVVECVEAERNNTEAAVEEVSRLIGNCAAAEITVILTQLRTILSQLGDLQTDVEGQTKTLTDCSDDELTCLLSFLGSAVTTIKKIPDVVKQDITEILQLVKTVIGDISKCDAKTTIKDRTQNIFNEIVVCIKQ